MNTSYKIINDIEQRKENLHYPTQEDINLYRYIFFQHAKGYILSKYPGSWETIHRPPADQDILDHFNFIKWIGPRYQKVTSWSILDHDNKTLDEVYETHSMIGATTSNSMLCTSVSPGGFHTILRVAPIDAPISKDLVQSSFETYPKELICSVFPMLKQGVRGPFGKDQKCVYECHKHLHTVNDKLNCFLNMDIFDLQNVHPYDHKNLDLLPDLPEAHSHPVIPVSIDLSSRSKPHRNSRHYSEEKVIILNVEGLTKPGTRDYAQTMQFIDQYSQEVPLAKATQFVIKFMLDKHKGFSKDFNRDPNEVIIHISGQGKRVYDHLRKWGILPEDIHCSEREFITEACFSFLLDNGTGDLPYVKFLIKAAVYSSSRQHRELIRVRWDLLRKWSSDCRYLKHIEKMEAQGIGKRGSDYRYYYYSKYLMLNLPKMNPDDAILFHGRPAKTFEEALVATRTRSEARKLLRDKGFQKRNANIIVQRYYKCSGNKSDGSVQSEKDAVRNGESKLHSTVVI